MKEIGGYIEMEYFRGNVYHGDALALNSGRHALEYVLRAKSIKKVYLPNFLCNSVSEICKKVGAEIEYYPVNRNLRPVFEGKCGADEAFYVVNYYGQLEDAEILALKEDLGGNIIVDNAQAFFRRPIAGVDTIYTCRKFFGVADGGYLYTDCELNEELLQDVSFEKMMFLMGRLERTAEEFYPLYKENNAKFSNAPLMRMSKLTENLLRGVDYGFVAERRSANFAYLHDKFKDINGLALTVPEGAFMYPLLVKNADEIRKALQEKKIYIPTLWPEAAEFNELARDILPLPVDQRYGEAEMQIMMDEILQ